MTPPTWRALAARARRLGLQVLHGPHAAVVRSRDVERSAFVSWVGGSADSIILRTAVAAALDQLEARR